MLGGKKHTKLLGQGHGRNLKEAEFDAAYHALATNSSSTLDDLRMPESPPLPDWLHEMCRHEGRLILRKMCGKDFSDDVREAILIPFKHDRVHVKCLRGALAAVGGKARTMMAVNHLSNHVANHQELTRQVSVVNSNTHLIAIVLETPLGNWMRSLSTTVEFSDATQAGPIIHTLNSLIGALILEYGFEACKPMETILFSHTANMELDGKGAARSRLQQAVQAVLKNDFSSLFRLETKPLHKPREVHDPRFEVTVFLAGVQLGQGVASKKKLAIEEACRVALVNPRLKEILEELQRQQE